MMPEKRKPRFFTLKWQPQTTSQFAGFVFTGAANTVLTFLIYEMALFMGLHYIYAFILCFLAGLVFLTFSNIRLVFGRKIENRNAAVYSVYYFLYFILYGLILYAVIEIVGLSPFLAPFFVLPIMVPVNFLCSKYVIENT